MAQKILNGVHISGSTQIDFMPTHESEGIITLGRYDANTSRYHNIKSYVSSTQSSNYLKFSLHNGTANTVVDVLTLDGSKNATFAGDVSALAMLVNPSYADSNEYLSIHKRQSKDGGIVFRSRPTGGSGQNDWQILNHGSTGDLRFFAYGLNAFALTLDREDGNATFAGNVDVNGTQITVGNNNSIFAENNLRFKSSGSAFIDHNTNGQSIVFRTSTSSSLDTTPLTLTNANATFAGDLTIPQYLKHASDADTYFGFSASNQVLFHVGGGDRLIINSAGNVGIGNTSPSDKLDVSGNIRISSDASNNADAGSLLFLEGPGQTWGTNAYGFRIQHNGSSNILNFESSNITTNQTIFTLTRDTARVGIGTTSPETKMHIKLAGGSGQLTLERTGSGAGKTVLAGAADGLIVYDDGFSPKMYVGTSGSYEGNVGIGTIVPGVLLDIFGDGEEWLRIVGGASNISGIRLGSSSNSRQNVLYRNRSNDLLTIRAGIDDSDIQIIAGGSANEIMRFDGSNSRVGIGTTTPTARLNVKSSGSNLDEISLTHSGNTVNIASLGQESGHGSLVLRNNSGAIQTRLSAGGNNSYILNSNVGIGTSSPAANLHIQDSAGANIILNSNTASAGGGIYMTEGSAGTPLTTGTHVYYDGSSNLFKIDTGTSSLTTRFVITRDTGNVGIGTTAPTAKLTVVGLAEYADNAAAISAGLTTGAFYRTGDLLKVVH